MSSECTSKFSVLSKGNLRPLSDVLETILFLDFKTQGRGPPKLLWDLKVPPLLPPCPSSVWGLLLYTSSILEPLKRYGINPKTRSRDGFAVKLQPLASCDKPDTPSPHIPDTGRSRSPPPGRLRPIGMNPGQPLSEPSSPAVAPSSSTLPPRTAFAVPEHGPVKGKPPLQVKQGPIHQRICPPPAPDTPFFTIVPKKVKMRPPKGATKSIFSLSCIFGMLLLPLAAI